jgi:hypothetical protein
MTIPRSQLSDQSWTDIEIRSGGIFLGREAFVDPKVTEDIRERLVRELSKQPDVAEVTDLFDPEETELQLRIAFYEVARRFLPLVFVLRVSFVEGRRTKSIPCLIVMDGHTILIGIVSLSAPRFVLSDRLSDIISEEAQIFASARERILEIAKRVCRETRMVPPTVTHGGLFVTNQQSLKIPKDVPVLKLTGVSLREAMKQTYIALEDMLTSFYLSSRLCNEVSSISRQISSMTSKILELVESFANTSIRQVFTRRSIARKIRLETTRLLSLLTQHNARKSELESGVEALGRSLHETNVASVFLEEIGWKEYVTCGDVDTALTLTVLDHARSEIQSSGIESMTVWAALVSAIVAALVTLLSSWYHP